MDDDVTCPGPSEQIGRVSFEVPPLACDTHAHVISQDRERFPFIVNRSYTPPPAPESRYLQMLDALGVDRGVLIQISIYGEDNRVMLETLARHPDRLRGVAVASATLTDKDLNRMHEAGVRGLRINTLLKGGVGYEQMERLAQRIRPLGWHLQFLASAHDLPSLMDRLRRLPVPCVLDHMGDLRADTAADDVSLRTLQTLVRDHGWWVKLSGAYRMGVPCHRLEETTQVARSLIAAGPERMLWGSDWPHVNVTEMPDTGDLLNLLAHWIPDAATRHRILVENPAALYGFV